MLSPAFLSQWNSDGNCGWDVDVTQRWCHVTLLGFGCLLHRLSYTAYLFAPGFFRLWFIWTFWYTDLSFAQCNLPISFHVLNLFIYFWLCWVSIAMHRLSLFAASQTWVWVNSGSWWWTGRPGVLRFMGSQRVGHDWASELNWTEGFLFVVVCVILTAAVFLVAEHRLQGVRASVVAAPGL